MINETRIGRSVRIILQQGSWASSYLAIMRYLYGWFRTFLWISAGSVVDMKRMPYTSTTCHANFSAYECYVHTISLQKIRFTFEQTVLWYSSTVVYHYYGTGLNSSKQSTYILLVIRGIRIHNQWKFTGVMQRFYLQDARRSYGFISLMFTLCTIWYWNLSFSEFIQNNISFLLSQGLYESLDRILHARIKAAGNFGYSHEPSIEVSMTCKINFLLQNYFRSNTQYKNNSV